MAEDRALLWMVVCILIILGFIISQFAAVAVAAAVGAFLVYRYTLPKSTEEPMWGEASQQS